MATSFDQNAYDIIREGCQRSAEALVPIVLDRLDVYQPRTVVDVGGGEGFWAHEFERHGCDAEVLDGPDANPDEACDLTQPFRPGLGLYDLAVCLEVAEHLPTRRADSFIADLCSLAPVVLFSAAIPGQGGIGHLNEQWPAYWVERFEANGYRVTGDLRWTIWEDDRIENWYRQNLLVATRIDLPLTFEPVLPVVHPVLYDARR